MDKERITDKMDDLEQCLRELEEYLPGKVDDSIAYRCLYGESGDFYEFLEEIERFITLKIGGSGERQNVTGD